MLLSRSELIVGITTVYSAFFAVLVCFVFNYSVQPTVHYIFLLIPPVLSLPLLVFRFPCILYLLTRDLRVLVLSAR